MKNNNELPDYVKNLKPISDEDIKECFRVGMEIRKSIEKATKETVRIYPIIRKGL